MDWGFVDVEDEEGNEWRSACFVMVCHHCGFRYVEFFPNARQENLFIGMIHSFALMGIPRRVLTDNMKSVATGRDAVGNVIYNREYDEFQHLLGFRTDLCKVAHPFTKGSVERLVRYVKGNFIQARRFLNVTDLNEKALAWCMEKNGKVLRERQCIPMEEHKQEKEGMIQMCDVSILLPYLAPFRSISFDGYVEYEGRRFGVPYSYSERKARVMRSGSKLKILTAEGNLVKEYPVDWSKASKSCPEQWLPVEGPSMPEEKPTTAVRREARSAPMMAARLVLHTPPTSRSVTMVISISVAIDISSGLMPLSAHGTSSFHMQRKAKANEIMVLTPEKRAKAMMRAEKSNAAASSLPSLQWSIILMNMGLSSISRSTSTQAISPGRNILSLAREPESILTPSITSPLCEPERTSTVHLWSPCLKRPVCITVLSSVASTFALAPSAFT